MERGGGGVANLGEGGWRSISLSRSFSLTHSLSLARPRLGGVEESSPKCVKEQERGGEREREREREIEREREERQLQQQPT